MKTKSPAGIKHLISAAFPQSSKGNAWAMEAGSLLLRLVFGLSLALAHGLGKIPPSEKFVSGVSGLGFPLPELFAWLASLSEFAGALCLAVGLFTRPAAFFVAFTMAVAFFGAHASDPFKVKELSLLYGTAALSLFFMGSGCWSIDGMLRKKLGR